MQLRPSSVRAGGQTSTTPNQYHLGTEDLAGLQFPRVSRIHGLKWLADSSSVASDYEKPTDEKVRRTLGGAVAHFEAGASITNVLFASDLSVSHISGLPLDSNQESVLALLRSHDLDTSKVSDVRVIRGDKLSNATVQAEDPDFAKAVSVKLRPQTTSTTQAGPRIQAVSAPVDLSTASDSSALRVDCRKVHCSWHKPARTVWLNFGNGDIADRVGKKFKDGQYKILDQTVQPNDPTRGAGRHNPKAWTLCLTEVPAAATKKDVEGSIHSRSDKPRDVQLGKPTYDGDADTCSAVVQSLFTAVGPLEWWELTPDTTGKRMKASARYLNEEDAKESARTLNNSTIPFHRAARLTVQLVYSAKFKVSSVIFEAVQSQLKSNLPSWKKMHLHYVAYPQSDPPKWYRVLRIEGEMPKDVAAAKDTIANTLAGVVARDGPSAPLWHPSLLGNGPLNERLRELQRETGVLIVRDKVKSQLRLYGPPQKCEQVQPSIAALLRAEGLQEYPIDLSTEQFHWACQGGFKKISAELDASNANANVRFDIIPTPKRIIITGTAADYSIARDIINGIKEIPSEVVVLKKGKDTKSAPPPPPQQDCSVCWTEAEDPIRTKCNHIYCLDCFENLCLSAATQDSAVQIRCVGGGGGGGDSGSCATVLGLPELQEYLSSSAFEELLEQSFASYVRLHPQLIRHCPSPQCEYVYRVNSGGGARMHTCRSCLVPVCTGCQAQHEGVSCADHQEVASGRARANEDLKREMGIKDCPVCKTPLEKTEGCDHMTCRCGAHICWVCLKTFEAAGACYTHMTREHGGIGLGHYQEMFG
ncbi:hypothetical protein SLS62_007815 [Diatrype stigma]|uniref:RING-type domain-containing protein n=1 Tax=Diatrype stigma TaxID=117547 RepID=A0AAN9UMN9_9PEZI